MASPVSSHRLLSRGLFSSHLLSDDLYSSQFLSRDFNSSQFLSRDFNSSQFLSRDFNSSQFLSLDFNSYQFLSRVFSSCLCMSHTYFNSWFLTRDLSDSQFLSGGPSDRRGRSLPITLNWSGLVRCGRSLSLSHWPGSARHSGSGLISTQPSQMVSAVTFDRARFTSSLCSVIAGPAVTIFTKTVVLAVDNINSKQLPTISTWEFN